MITQWATTTKISIWAIDGGVKQYLQVVSVMWQGQWDTGKNGTVPLSSGRRTLYIDKLDTLATCLVGV